MGSSWNTKYIFLTINQEKNDAHNFYALLKSSPCSFGKCKKRHGNGNEVNEGGDINSRLRLQVIVKLDNNSPTKWN